MVIGVIIYIFLLLFIESDLYLMSPNEGDTGRWVRCDRHHIMEHVSVDSVLIRNKTIKLITSTRQQTIIEKFVWLIVELYTWRDNTLLMAYRFYLLNEPCSLFFQLSHVWRFLLSFISCLSTFCSIHPVSCEFRGLIDWKVGFNNNW